MMSRRSRSASDSTAIRRNQPTGGPESLADDDGWVLGAEESTDVGTTAAAREVINRSDPLAAQ